VPAARASSAPLPTEVSLARIISQGLIPATAAPDVVAAVSRQLAIQGQQVSAVPHALLVRAPQATPVDVEAAFGGDFLPFFGDDAHVLRAHAQGVFEHFFGECHFEVDVGADGAGDLCDVVVFDVSTVFAQVQGDVVRAVGFGQQGGFERGRVACAARVAQGGDVVDIDS